jgi:hypothetical protein
MGAARSKLPKPVRKALQRGNTFWHVGGKFLLTRRALRTAREKQIIFCLTNGRSGTASLAALFACIAGVEAHHEPKPQFKLWRSQVQRAPHLARRFLAERKLPAISQSQYPIYVETSHFLAKGFFLPLLDMGIVPDLVVLSRDRRPTALSMLRLDTIPGRSNKGLHFYISPDDPVLVPLPDWRQLSDYQLCYWHVLESEARQRNYAKIARDLGARIVVADVSDLSRPERFESIAKTFGIPLTEDDRGRIARIAKVKHNQKLLKKRNAPTLDFLHEEAEVLARCRLPVCP